MLDLERFNALPLPVKIATFAMLGCCVLFGAVLVSTWSSIEIDSGFATLVGSFTGLCVVAWQTNRGFRNLVKSQDNQARLEREARVHQYELDEKKSETDTDRAKRVLVSALWAEVYSLHNQVSDARSTAWMMHRFYENMSKRSGDSGVKEVGFAGFEAPIYQANINHLGLLGASLAADVVLVASKAKGSSPKIKSELNYSNDVLATIYKGNADMLNDWAHDLFHVANRLSAVMNNQPDPGRLWDAQQARKAEQERSKQQKEATP